MMVKVLSSALFRSYYPFESFTELWFCHCQTDEQQGLSVVTYTVNCAKTSGITLGSALGPFDMPLQSSHFSLLCKNYAMKMITPLTSGGFRFIDYIYGSRTVK